MEDEVSKESNRIFRNETREAIIKLLGKINEYFESFESDFFDGKIFIETFNELDVIERTVGRNFNLLNDMVKCIKKRNEELNKL